MLLSKNEMVGWGIAVIVIVVMGFLSFHGPFHDINKPAAAQGMSVVHVRIETDSQTVGKYVPSTVRVHVGQEVVFTNDSNADHTVTQTNDVFDSGNIATGGQSWTYVPKHTGHYRYGCSYHPLMFGNLIVEG